MQTILDRKIIIALTLYVTALLATNTLGLKLMPFLFGTHLSTSVFFFPFVFLMTDVIGDVYGKKMAQSFVFAGFLATVLFLVFNLVSNITPWSSEALWVKDSYNAIFTISIRISIASLLAFIIGEYQDVLFFFFIKKKIERSTFFIRSTLSNIWSQFLDTTIFMFVAFLGIFSVKTIILMAIPWWIYKVLMGMAYMPLSYLGIKLLKGKSKNETSHESQIA